MNASPVFADNKECIKIHLYADTNKISISEVNDFFLRLYVDNWCNKELLFDPRLSSDDQGAIPTEKNQAYFFQIFKQENNKLTEIEISYYSDGPVFYPKKMEPYSTVAIYLPISVIFNITEKGSYVIRAVLKVKSETKVDRYVSKDFLVEIQ